jgi:hypothetical protein
MERLFVGEHRGGDHAEPDGQLLVTEHDHGAEQEDNGSGDLGGQPFGVGIGFGIDEIAGSHESTDDQYRRGQDPRRRQLAREPAGHSAQQGEQCEGA